MCHVPRDCLNILAAADFVIATDGRSDDNRARRFTVLTVTGDKVSIEKPNLALPENGPYVQVGHLAEHHGGRGQVFWGHR